MNEQRLPQQQQQLPTCSDFLKELPFLYRVLLFTWVLAWILSIAFEELFSLFLNYYPLTIENVQLWRLFTNILYQPSLLTITLCLMNFHTFLPKMEFKHGTIVVLLNLLIYNLVIQLLASLIQFLMLAIFSHDQQESRLIFFAYFGADGIMGVWVHMMYKFCFYNPALVKFCMCGWKIGRRSYPFVIVTIICIVQWQIRSAIVAGLCLAIIQCMLLEKGLIQLPESLYDKLETCALKIRLGGGSSWVSFNSALRGDMVTQSLLYSILENVQKSSSRSTSVANNSFVGKQGYRLSDADS